MRPGQVQGAAEGNDCQSARQHRHCPSPAEAPFYIVKNIFGMKKVPYKGLIKSTSQLFTLFSLANPLIVKRRLFGAQCPRWGLTWAK